ncbi:PAS domain S-box protein [Marinomonas sp. THO17]|uniref:PAS domain S-box protein n=1 Tax=Marinomonas sp. THO17 TaxID=3149048 RepID=UPI00336C0CFD
MSKVEATLKIAQSLMAAPYAALVYQNGQIVSNGKLKHYSFADALATNLAMQGSHRIVDIETEVDLPPILRDISSLRLCFVEPIKQCRATLVCLGEEPYSRTGANLDQDLEALVSLLATILSGQSGGIARQDLLNLHDNIPAFVALVDKDLRYEFVNETYERRFSLPRQEIIGKRIPELIPAEYFSKISDKLAEGLLGKPVNYNYQVNIGDNKEQRFIQSSYVPRFENGQVTGLYLCMQDITAQRRTINTLKSLHSVTADSELSLDEKLQKILSVGCKQFSLPFGLISKIDGSLYEVKHAFTPNGEVPVGATFELDGTYCVHTLNNDLPTAYHHTGISEIQNHPCYQAFGLEAYIGIVIYVDNQRYGTLNFSSPNPKFEAFGEDDFELMKLLGQWVGNAITTHLAEVKIKQAKRQQELILEAVHEGIFGISLEGEITFVNTAACNILGYLSENILGKNILNLVNTSEPSYLSCQPVLTAIQHTLSSGQQSQVRAEHVSQTGEQFVCEYSCMAVRDEQNRITGAVVSFQDRTEQIHAEQDLREQKKMFESLFMNAPEAIVFVDHQRVIKMVNPAFCDMFGYQVDEVIGQTTEHLYAAESDYVDLGHKYYGEQHIESDRYLAAYRSKQGGIFHAETIGSRIEDQDGQLLGYIAHVRDVSQRLEVERKMINTNIRLSIAADAAGIGVWEFDLADRHLQWDDWMYRLYGISKDHKTSPMEVWEASVHPEDREKLQEILSGIEQSGFQVENQQEASAIAQKLDFDFRITRRDGQLRYLKSNAAVLFDEQGVATRLVGVNMDITSRKETEELLRTASEQAVAASKAKSNFLATMSHEIRTPLNGVLGMAELMAGTKLDREQSEQLRVLRDSGESLLELIDGILDFSKIEAGHLSIERVDFDLEKAIFDVVRLLMVKAEEKGIDLLVEYQDSCPRYLVGDVFRIKQVLTNLVSNAIKFTHVGHVLISVKGQTDKQGRVSFVMSISDTGVGIAKEAQPHLFNAFVQADSSTTRKFGGTGLGLAITKQLVGLMNGSVALDSELNIGSCFSVSLTLPESHAKPRPEVVADEALLVGKKTIVIDDNETNLTILKNQLSSFGIAAHTESKPQKALSRIHGAYDNNQAYEIIILDYMMPELDGLMLSRKIRELCGSLYQPIILITSSAGLLSHQELTDAGINLCIAKPMGARSLKKGLAYCLSKDVLAYQVISDDQTAIEEVSSEQTLSKRDSRDRILVVEDMKANMAVAHGVLSRMGFEVIEATNGAIGVECWQEYHPNLILMDLHMPVMDGLTAMRHIRQAEKNQQLKKRVPIFALTADIMPETSAEVFRAGGDGVLPKPFKQIHLSQIIEEWLPNHDHDSLGGEDLIQPAQLEAKDSVIDISVLHGLKEALGGDIRLLVNAFFEDTESLMSRFDEIHYSSEAAEKISQLAHSLKSVSQNVGAMALSELAARLEIQGREGEIMDYAQQAKNLKVMYQKVKNELNRVMVEL